MYKYRTWLLTSMIMFSNQALPLSCPDNKTAPLCPNSGSTLLDETYPTQAFVISNAPYLKDMLSSKKVTSDFISKIAKSYNYKNVPQVLVTVANKEEFDSIVEKVKAELKKDKLSDSEIRSVLGQITHAPTRNYTWQQDYFESFVDLKTGTPVLREFQSYFRNPGGVTSIESVSKDCPIKKGELLENYHDQSEKNKSFGSGEMGGNVDGAPGGFCLIGDNLSRDLSKKFCGGEDNIIQLQTSWLNVGHVDEVFKIIPSRFNDNRPSECQFSLMVASPQKAMELLSNSQTGSLSFFKFSSKLNEDELYQKKFTKGDQRAYFGAKFLCGYIKNSINDGSYIPQKSLIRQQNDKMVWSDFFISDAHAILEEESKVESENEFNCLDHLDQISNRNIGNAINKDEELRKLNQVIQESLNKDKQLIKNKILSRLPQCKKYFDILDVPNLFYGSPPIEKNGKLELPRPSDVDSFLPNPTNSVLMNRTVLIPETGNPAFDDYVEFELKKRNLLTDYIDSWDYAHLGKGNIHCSSHSILYCKPR